MLHCLADWPLLHCPAILCDLCKFVLPSPGRSRLTTTALPAGAFIDDDRSEGEVEPDREEAHHAADDVSTALEDAASSGDNEVAWVNLLATFLWEEGDLDRN